MSNCLICGKEGKLKFKEINLYECSECGFFFKDYGINYEELEDEYYNLFNYDRKKETKQFEKIIYRNFPDKKKLKLLEIGCGTGALLSEFKNDGFDVYGVEPSKKACEMAKEKFGLENIIEGYFDNGKYSFCPDVIILSDVIEHLQYPLDLFKQIKLVMSSETIFFVKSGNPHSITARLHPAKWGYFNIEQHIAFYSKKALSKLCQKSALSLCNYYIFINYFGGMIYKEYLKNIGKAMVLKVLKTPNIQNRFGIRSINDHFIAIIKLNNAK
jgi:2-polyprenyl-3-methyl-5-hydroxy-6-metoxy-1,4-benzoquinol methylase